MTEEKTENQNVSIMLNGHYIKQLSFDNINAPASFMEQKEPPKIEIAVNFNNRNIQENLYEVHLLVKIKANAVDEGNTNLFDVKLNYCGLFTIENILDDAQKESILMIYCPTLLFPYVRRIVSDITRDAGFQPIMLEHIDFANVHQQRKAQKEASASEDVIVN